jgi:hypothetical protein
MEIALLYFYLLSLFSLDSDMSNSLITLAVLDRAYVYPRVCARSFMSPVGHFVPSVKHRLAGQRESQ